MKHHVKIVSRCIAIILFLTSSLNVTNVWGADNPIDQDPSQDSPSQNGNALFLPYVLGEYPPPQSVFGVEITIPHPNYNAKAETLQTYWVRNATFSWAAIEPNPPNSSGKPTYDWSSVSESYLIDAYQRELTVIATVKYAPKWARRYKKRACGPIAEENLDEFARFMKDLVKKYSAAPYNIKYWELGNEPDIQPWVFAEDDEYPLYGCWGDPDSNTYGGKYYGKMLKKVYPAIKAADPQANVLIGGLLLDCDPTVDSNCKSGNFFKGILETTGGNYFDIVSFHSYAGFSSSGNIIDETHPKWAHRGGVVVGKIDFLKEVMNNYGVNKPIMLTEVALFCAWGCTTPDDDFLDAQADFVVTMFTRIWQANLMGAIWFTLPGPGWRDCGLLDSKGLPRPSHDAYFFMTEELYNFKLTGKVIDYPGIKGYKFARSGKNVWLMWSADRQIPVEIELPAGWKKVMDKFGTILFENTNPPVGNKITVDHPIYVELIP